MPFIFLPQNLFARFFSHPSYFKWLKCYENLCFLRFLLFQLPWQDPKSPVCVPMAGRCAIFPFIPNQMGVTGVPRCFKFV